MITARQMATDAADTASFLLVAKDCGTPLWWDRIKALGTPLTERIGERRMRVTFLFRASGPTTQRVYIDVNGVTDHHSPDPQSLERIGATDVWFWQVELPSDWHGSYAFIPATTADAPPSPTADEAERSQRHREWWVRIAASAQADVLNRESAHPSGWGGEASALHLPDAPDQSPWLPSGLPERKALTPDSFEWHSAIQGKRRTVWHHRTGTADAPPRGGLPLVLLLDGRNWAERMPLAPVLDAETAAGRLLPALYLFVDSINGFHREQDLAPNALFWSAIGDELLPLASKIAPITGDSAYRVVAGQSYGGLAALHAVLAHPDQWGSSIAQSPSLWWPDETIPRARLRRPGADGELTQRLRAGVYPPGTRRIFMEVGAREGVMIDVARTMRDALEAHRQELIYREYEGGHDIVCWRSGLIDGLRRLLAAPSPNTQNQESFA